MTYRTRDPNEDTHEHVTYERERHPAGTGGTADTADTAGRAEGPQYGRPAAGGDQVNVNAGGDRAYVRREPGPLAMVRRVLGLIFGVLLALIALRILLLALGANEGNAIVDGIYAITEPLVAPFRGVFSIDEVRPVGRSVLDVAALVAIVGWSLIALLIMAILRIPDRA